MSGIPCQVLITPGYVTFAQAVTVTIRRTRMAERDMIANAVQAALDGLFQVPGHGNWNNPTWDIQVKTALCNAVRQAIPSPGNHLVSCATGVNRANLIPPPDEFYPAFLYKVTCLRYELKDWLKRETLLVAQVNWGDAAPILQNFVKLLVSRAKVRVMVYFDGLVELDQFKQVIRDCHDTQIGDTYLLAARTPNGFQYHRIDWLP